jgi:hypothetical protein
LLHFELRLPAGKAILVRTLTGSLKIKRVLTGMYQKYQDEARAEVFVRWAVIFDRS